MILSSTFPSILLPALPFVFISSENHFIAASALRNTMPPANLQWTKHYYKPHIEDLRRQLNTVKELGSATAEEWIKGLDSEGKERMNDASRWEQWEAKGGLKKVNIRHNSRSTSLHGPRALETNRTGSKTDTLSNRSTPQSFCLDSKQEDSHGAATPLPARPIPSKLNCSTWLCIPRSVMRATNQIADNLVYPHLPARSSLDSLPPRPQGPVQQPRPDRNIRDVNEAKAARQAEIERRCMALDPPLTPEILHHMESFQASIQISTALTDNAWEVLKPRLLAQRENAERREHDRIQHGLIMQAKSEERRQQEAQIKEAKETLDKEWDAAQAPIKNQLASYAEEIIENSWSGGKSITKDTCPRFAADVLLHTRRRFYDDLARADAAVHTVGGFVRPDSPNGPPTRKLILENMKWLFDNKIKTLTENFQKELFLCNGCEGNFKFYGFEGVIQHYAAKHTTSLSMGSIVVHWRAEWPEHPPFNPNPSAAKAAYYAVPMPMTSNSQSQFSMAPHAAATYGVYGQAPAVPLRGPRSGYENAQFSPGPYHAQYQGRFQEGPYPPPSVPNQYAHNAGFQAHSQAYPQISHYPSDQSVVHHSHTGPLNGYNGYPTYSSPFIGAAYPAQMTGQELENGMAMQGPRGFAPSRPPNLPLKAVPPQVIALNHVRGMPNPGADLYQLQMNEMARHAREVWFGTSGIKDIPQSVRIHVVIHHVVSRFEEKYTNQPSLAMFIDGLDHHSLMRPVRSLNGLACKTCVTGGNGSGAGYHSHPQLAAGDRKLYTLPHLLIHFKVVHMEGVTPTIHSETGLETSRLDWKRDMIELPDITLIADLINALGMDDNKLKLIAWVFPGIFPSPLPRIDGKGNVGPTPRFKDTYNAGREILSQGGEDPPEPIRVSAYGEGENHNTPHLESYSAFRPKSSSTTRTSEPPGEDEYDPHRPAYLEKMMRASRSNTRSLKDIKEPPSEFQRLPERSGTHEEYPLGILDTATPAHARGGTTVTHPDRESVDAERLRNKRKTPSVRRSPFAEVSHQREHSKNLRLPPQLPSNENNSTRNHNGVYRNVSEDGELIEDSPSKRKRRVDSPKEGANAAERFLNNFDAVLVANDYERKEITPECDVEAKTPFLGVGAVKHGRGYVMHQDPIVDLPQSGDHSDRMRNSRATSIRTEAVELRNGEESRRSMMPQGYAQFEVRRPATTRTEATMTGRMSNRQSPEAYTSHGDVDVVIPPDLQALTEYRIDQPQSRHSQRQGPHIMRYRSRSRSPQPASRGETYYRARSPIDAGALRSRYRIHSPVLREDTGPQQYPYYDVRPPQSEYMYVSEREYPTGHQRPRVEYIPVRAEDYDRMEQDHYVAAQPRLQARPTEHMRLERGYADDAIYERDGRIYYAAPRSYESRQIRAPPLHSEYDAYRYQK